MITKYKIYEKIEIIKPPFEIGDYVITKSQNAGLISIFTDNNIGQLLKYYNNNGCRIKYDNIPKNLKGFFDNTDVRGFDLNQIIYWSKDKKDLEVILASKKYNL